MQLREVEQREHQDIVSIGKQIIYMIWQEIVMIGPKKRSTPATVSFVGAIAPTVALATQHQTAAASILTIPTASIQPGQLYI